MAAAFQAVAAESGGRLDRRYGKQTSNFMPLPQYLQLYAQLLAPRRFNFSWICVSDDWVRIELSLLGLQGLESSSGFRQLLAG